MKFIFIIYLVLMISINELKYLIANKLRDAQVLHKSKRYPSSIYLAGYALEIALKYKICRTLRFNKGFPENSQELIVYLQQINANNNANPLSIRIADIRNHDLARLLYYSGSETRIKGQFLNEWSLVSGWSPEDRYKKKRVTQKKCERYLTAIKVIIKEIS